MTGSEAGNGAALPDTGIAAVRYVLVGTTHPGNIGASARAMKAMGARQLLLVAPKTFPAAAATAMASGADDILAAARVHDTLAGAIADCTLVVATTARDRHLAWPVWSPREAAAEIRAASREGTVAVVFGREQTGLSNAELDCCQRAIRIPTDPGFNSLNLAQAVQICAYEIRAAFLSASAATVTRDAGERPATAQELEDLHRHFMTVMAAVGYFDPAHPRLLERRVRRFLNRARLYQTESQILRGFLAAIEQRLAGPGRRDPE